MLHANLLLVMLTLASTSDHFHLGKSIFFLSAVAAVAGNPEV